MAIRYVFKEDGVLAIKNAKRADPQAIGEALAKIEDLSPQSVVDMASKPRHALHRFFEWNDEKAANAFRLEQARTLIRSIQVEESDGPKPAYFSVRDRGKMKYRTYSDVMSSESLRLAVLQSARRDLEAWENRYSEIEDAVQIVSKARRGLERRIEEQRPSA